MPGIITALRFQKQTADRVNVYLDGHYAFAVPALKAARLRVGQQLDDTAIADLQASGDVQKAYNRAVHFLGYRPRSTAEVRRHLAEAGVAPDAIEAALTQLSAQGYLDDAEFARFWIENRQRFRPKGAQALRQELRQHGVTGEVIEPALAAVDAAASAYEAAQPRALRMVALAQVDPQAFRRKLGEFLLRRGFDYAVAQDVVVRLLHEAQTEAEA